MASPTPARTDSKALAERREWISSREAVRLVTEAYATHDIFDYDTPEAKRRAAVAGAADAILRRLAEGALIAQPVWFRFVQGNNVDTAEHVFHLNQPDRTISPNFWRTLQRLKPVATLDWVAGDFSFEDVDAGIYAQGHATDVKFDRATLPGLDLSAKKQPASAGGAPRKWDWDGAFLHLAALAHGSADGLLRPDGGEPNQTDIAEILRAWFVDNYDDAPESSQLRFYGKRFITELNAVKLRGANNLPTRG